MSFPQWATRLLGSMGIAPTAPRLQFLTAWQQCEGGTAKNNPLNTTMAVAGATDYNHAGVKNYVDSNMGIAATLLTLRLGFYSDIRTALAAPNLTAAQIAARSHAGLDKWGTGHACIEAKVRPSRPSAS